MIQSTNVRLPKAPTVRPMIDISKFSVGHDFASLKTLNWKYAMNWMVGVGVHKKVFDFKLEAAILVSVLDYQRERFIERHLPI